MSKQLLLFPRADNSEEEKYSTKIDAPVYLPSHDKPHILTLCDSTKTMRLIEKINETALPENEKAFLRAAAWRHAVFHYERIADYYAHSAPEMQQMMEESALVIIDFDAAIERGFVKLCKNIEKQFMEEYCPQ